MGRTKGSKNKRLAEWTLYPRKNPDAIKSQFVTTEMVSAVIADFAAHRGLHGFDAVYAKYAHLYNEHYFCASGFDPLWVRLLKRIQTEHNEPKYINFFLQRKYDQKLAARNEKIAKTKADKPYRRNLKNPPVV